MNSLFLEAGHWTDIVGLKVMNPWSQTLDPFLQTHTHTHQIVWDVHTVSSKLRRTEHTCRTFVSLPVEVSKIKSRLKEELGSLVVRDGPLISEDKDSSLIFVFPLINVKHPRTENKKEIKKLKWKMNSDDEKWHILNLPASTLSFTGKFIGQSPQIGINDLNYCSFSQFGENCNNLKFNVGVKHQEPLLLTNQKLNHGSSNAVKRFYWNILPPSVTCLKSLSLRGKPSVFTLAVSGFSATMNMKLMLTRSVPLQMQMIQPSKSASVFPMASNEDKILGSWGQFSRRYVW